MTSELPPTLADDLPSVVVVVPVKDDNKRLLTCLRCLDQQTYPRGLVQVVVVDDGSQNLVKIPRSMAIRISLFSQRNSGSYSARNNGVLNSRSDVIAFTDSDCLPSSQWLENGIRKLIAKPNCGIVAGHIDLLFRYGRPSTPTEVYERVFAFRQVRNVNNHRAVTANWFSPRIVFEKAGGFDERLLSNGDYELARRIARMGYTISYSRAAVVAHPARRRLSEIRSKTQRVANGKIASARGNGVARALKFSFFASVYYVSRTIELVNAVTHLSLHQVFLGHLANSAVAATSLAVAMNRAREALTKKTRFACFEERK